jgi:hypothetical protein
MFGKTFKLFMVVAAVGLSSVQIASAGTFITDTLGGNGHARHAVTHVHIASTPSVAKGQTTCSATQAWKSVTDDQGLDWLVPVATLAPACAGSTVTNCSSIQSVTIAPGWAFSIDDLGVPWLVPVARSQGC